MKMAWITSASGHQIWRTVFFKMRNRRDAWQLPLAFTEGGKKHWKCVKKKAFPVDCDVQNLSKIMHVRKNSPRGQKNRRHNRDTSFLPNSARKKVNAAQFCPPWECRFWIWQQKKSHMGFLYYRWAEGFLPLPCRCVHGWALPNQMSREGGLSINQKAN